MRLIICTFVIAAAVASPAFAADKLVPQTAVGALEAHRGKPWTDPLFTCAGFSIYNARQLKAAGNMAGSWEAIGKGVELRQAGADRLVKDQGLTADAATAQATRRSEAFAFAIEAEDYGEADFIPGWTKACAEIAAGYKKAGL